MLFDYLKLSGSLEQQAIDFLDNTGQKGYSVGSEYHYLP
jgi:hypothetical protein